MTIHFELRLYDQNGYRVATFVEWLEFLVEVGVNRPATFALRLDRDDPRAALFEDDGILEGWWEDPEEGIAWRREFACWVTDQSKWTDKDGKRHAQPSGKGLEDLLGRTIIDTYAGSAEGQKSGYGETVIKAFVEEQLGPTAGARARPGLSVEALHSPALGTTWAGERSNKKVLGVVQEIAELTGVQFGIARTGRYTFEFQVWEPVDRQTTVIFSEDRDNMGEPKVEAKQSEVSNWIKCGGDDSGADRNVTYRSDPASIALSPQGRREAFAYAADQEPGEELETRGDAELAQNRASTGFSFQVRQTPGTLYGKHYFLGNYVKAIYDGVDYLRRIDVARWRVNRDGARLEIETVEVPLVSGS